MSSFEQGVSTCSSVSISAQPLVKKVVLIIFDGLEGSLCMHLSAVIRDPQQTRVSAPLTKARGKQIPEQVPEQVVLRE